MPNKLIRTSYIFSSRLPEK